jgi:hypothetical protein
MLRDDLVDDACVWLRDAREPGPAPEASQSGAGVWGTAGSIAQHRGYVVENPKKYSWRGALQLHDGF